MTSPLPTKHFIIILHLALTHFVLGDADSSLSISDGWIRIEPDDDSIIDDEYTAIEFADSDGTPMYTIEKVEEETGYYAIYETPQKEYLDQCAGRRNIKHSSVTSTDKTRPGVVKKIVTTVAATMDGTYEHKVVTKTYRRRQWEPLDNQVEIQYISAEEAGIDTAQHESILAQIERKKEYQAGIQQRNSRYNLDYSSLPGISTTSHRIGS